MSQNILTPKQIEVLSDAIIAADGRPRSYSGRNMYGDTCLGVTTDQSPIQFIITVCRELAKIDDPNSGTDDIFCLLEEDVKTDSMGRGNIVYFPSIAWSEEFETLFSDDDEDR